MGLEKPIVVTHLGEFARNSAFAPYVAMCALDIRVLSGPCYRMKRYTYSCSDVQGSLTRI